MDCKEFERLIPNFIKLNMDFRTMKAFRDHMEHCAVCKEELVIQFLVIEGMQRLEEGDAFDLQSELDAHLDEVNRRINRNYRFLEIGEMLELVLIVVVAAAVIWLML